MKFIRMLIIGVFSTVLLASCGGESSVEKVDGGASSANGAEGEQNQEQENDDEAKKKKETEKLKIGDTVNFDGLKITLNSVTADSGSEFEKPEEDRFLIVDMTVENTTEEPQTVSSLMNVSLRDDDDYEYTTALYTGVKAQLDGEVAPGDKLRGQIAFDVPKSKNYSLIFGDPFTSGQAIWTFKSKQVK